MEDMRKDNRNYRERAREFLQDKGVYLVLLLCIGIVGIAVAAAYLPGRPEQPEDTEQVAQSGDETLREAAATPAPTPRPAAAEPTAQPSPAPTPAPVPEVSPQPREEPQPTPAPAREKADPPVKGGVQWRFAIDELVYSQTLDQWMTHPGLDISAAKGEEVHAVWEGAVDEVYQDDSLGVSVRLSHKDGLETVYCNLRSDVAVEEGQRVAAGQVLGYVGDTARAECGQGAHLHFEVYRDGEAQDPAGLIITVGE